jgi:hypothetical protein
MNKLTNSELDRIVGNANNEKVFVPSSGLEHQDNNKSHFKSLKLSGLGIGKLNKKKDDDHGEPISPRQGKK